MSTILDDPRFAGAHAIPVRYGEPCTLVDCPPGLFWGEGDWGAAFGFKSEYGDDAYVVESGEFWWGGAKTHPERREQLVRPVALGWGK